MTFFIYFSDRASQYSFR